MNGLQYGILWFQHPYVKMSLVFFLLESKKKEIIIIIIYTVYVSSDKDAI